MRPWRGPRAEKGGHGVFHAAGGVCRSFLEHSKVRGSSSGLLDGYWLALAGWSFLGRPRVGVVVVVVVVRWGDVWCTTSTY